MDCPLERGGVPDMLYMPLHFSDKGTFKWATTSLIIGRNAAAAVFCGFDALGTCRMGRALALRVEQWLHTYSSRRFHFAVCVYVCTIVGK
jgi:hypothetical protein